MTLAVESGIRKSEGSVLFTFKIVLQISALNLGGSSYSAKPAIRIWVGIPRDVLTALSSTPHGMFSFVF